jgi:hypothetical protein
MRVIALGFDPQRFMLCIVAENIIDAMGKVVKFVGSFFRGCFCGFDMDRFGAFDHRVRQAIAVDCVALPKNKNLTRGLS